MASPKSAGIPGHLLKLRALLNKEVIDLILFGSAVKGGTPKDTDIAVLVRDRHRAEQIQQAIKAYVPRADIQILDIESIHSPIWLTLIREGYSIRHRKRVSEMYHIQPVVLYKYSLTRLTNVQKVQFERGIKNILKDEGVFLTRSVVLMPLHLKSRMMEFLKSWNIYYEAQEYELLPLMRKETFL